ncbi:CCN family member 1-like [Cololabis saira]|uniref:CCN family member 1-like n=1 Tax=Cololabis saira TaxID=129043 RepID=UPI002AD318D6|nr:CCN family member 1-like [Cololabis saira]
MLSVFVLVILCVALVSASCPTDCRCPSEVPVCAAGVSLVLDSCGCCQVCARQLFEDCSKRQPCDTAKGLDCNFGGGHGSATGICRAKSDGRTCEFNSRIHQNGETFRPNCKYQCTCMDGSVGCISLCPQKVSLSKLGCAKPMQVKVWGQCCEQLICPDDAKTERSTTRKHSQDKTSEDDLTTKNDLLPVWTGALKSLPALRSHPMGRILARGVQCVPYTTPWSPCSKSCNTGVSTRSTNNNVQCKLVTETRVCEIQPCKHIPSKKAKKCNHQGKATQPVKLSYAGCRSLKRFQLTDCGSCSHGKCCRPNKTQAPSVRFQCKNGETFRRKVMLTESCSCDDSCSSTNQKPLGVNKLFNDIYKPKM